MGDAPRCMHGVPVDQPCVICMTCTEDNPTGAWNLPYEPLDEPLEAELEGISVDSVNVKGGIAGSPLGPLGVVVFEFASSATGPINPIHLLATTPEQFRRLGRLMRDAANHVANRLERAQSGRRG